MGPSRLTHGNSTPRNVTSNAGKFRKSKITRTMESLSSVIFAILAVSGCFATTTNHFYVLLGSKFTIPCGDISTPQRNITWLHERATVEGDDYQISPSELVIKNVSQKKLGKYECVNYLAETRTEESNQIFLHPIKPPKFEHDLQYSIFGTVNKLVTMWCRVISTPPANLTWYKYGQHISPLDPKYNITNTRKMNNADESMLQFPISNNNDYGVYTCKATNEANTTTENYTLEDLPVPIIDVKSIRDGSLEFHAQVKNPPVNFTGYRARYQKQSNSEGSIWIYTEPYLPGQDMYSVQGLEPDTAYNLQFGACYDSTRCAFNDTIPVHTVKSAGSVVAVHFAVQFLIVTAAFVVGLL